MKRILLSAFLLFQSPGFCSGAASLEEMSSAANRHFNDGLYKEAEGEYKKLIEAYPEYAVAYNNLGIIASTDITRLKDSVTCFLKAIELDRSYADPYSSLGVICFRINETDNALLYLTRALKLQPRNFRHYFNLGWVYLEGRKDVEEAKKYFQKAIQLNGKYAESVYALGAACADSGDIPAVLEIITKLRALNREDLARALENEIRKPEEENSGLPIPSLIPKQAVKADYEISPEQDVSSGTAKITGSATIRIKITGAMHKRADVNNAKE